MDKFFDGNWGALQKEWVVSIYMSFIQVLNCNLNPYHFVRNIQEYEGPIDNLEPKQLVDDRGESSTWLILNNNLYQSLKHLNSYKMVLSVSTTPPYKMPLHDVLRIYQILFDVL